MMVVKNSSEANTTIKFMVKGFKVELTGGWRRPRLAAIVLIETEYPSDDPVRIRTLRKGDSYNYTLTIRAEVET